MVKPELETLSSDPVLNSDGLMDRFKDQLLIVLLKRLGGEGSIPVAEVDDTGQDLAAADLSWQLGTSPDWAPILQTRRRNGCAFPRRLDGARAENRITGAAYLDPKRAIKRCPIHNSIVRPSDKCCAQLIAASSSAQLHVRKPTNEPFDPVM